MWHSGKNVEKRRFLGFLNKNNLLNFAPPPLNHGAAGKCPILTTLVTTLLNHRISDISLRIMKEISSMGSFVNYVML